MYVNPPFGISMVHLWWNCGAWGGFDVWRSIAVDLSRNWWKLMEVWWKNGRWQNLKSQESVYPVYPARTRSTRDTADSPRTRSRIFLFMGTTVYWVDRGPSRSTRHTAEPIPTRFLRNCPTVCPVDPRNSESTWHTVDSDVYFSDLVSFRSVPGQPKDPSG